MPGNGTLLAGVAMVGVLNNELWGNNKASTAQILSSGVTISDNTSKEESVGPVKLHINGGTHTHTHSA
jgi:hypothetical protein